MNCSDTWTTRSSRARISTRDGRRHRHAPSRLRRAERKSTELVDAFADRGLTANAYSIAADRLDAQRKQLDVKLGKLMEQSPLDWFAGNG